MQFIGDMWIEKQEALALGLIKSVAPRHNYAGTDRGKGSYTAYSMYDEVRVQHFDCKIQVVILDDPMEEILNAQTAMLDASSTLSNITADGLIELLATLATVSKL